MQQTRGNFLNWKPDLEDDNNQGLTVAENVIHEPEGYKPLHLATAGSFSQSGGMSSVTSVVSKPIGSAGDVFSAWIASNGNICVGVNGYTATTSSTGYPLSFSTVSNGGSFISFMGVCEYEDNVYFTVESFTTQTLPAVTVTSMAFSGYIARP